METITRDDLINDINHRIDCAAKPKPGKPFYIYHHKSGQLIMKPAVVVESDPLYFDSPFVLQVWKIDGWESVRRFAEDTICKHINYETFIKMFNL